MIAAMPTLAPAPRWKNDRPRRIRAKKDDAMTIPQFMALAFPWLNPLGSDCRNMQAAWDAGYKAGKEAK